MLRLYDFMTEMLSTLMAIIAFIANVLFFIWFGRTLNSIDRHLGDVADHSARQTKLLASLANSTPGPEPAPRKPELPTKRSVLQDWLDHE